MARRSGSTARDDLPAGGGALRRACERLLEECRGTSSEVPEPTALCEEVARIVSGVEARLAGGSPPALPPARADRARILDRLRAYLLEDWPEGEEEGLLRVLRAMEAVRASSSDVEETLLSPGVLAPYGHRLLREVAHTVRSPMGSIVMLAGTLADGAAGEVNALQRKHLGIIHRAALSLANMTSDLLNLTGEDSGTRADPEPLHVQEIVKAVADAVAPLAEERHLRFSSRAPDGSTRLGHPVALEKALMNLTLNAALLTREGELDLSASPLQEDVLFSVSVAPVDEDVDSLFVVFPSPGEEADYTLSRSGLGFATARDLVRRMGSELEVERSAAARLRMSFRLALPPQA